MEISSGRLILSTFAKCIFKSKVLLKLLYTFLQYRPVEIKKNSGGVYQLRNIAGHHGWPIKKIFHFKLSKTARKT